MDEQTQQMILMLAQVYMDKTGEQDPQAALQAVVQLVQAAQQEDPQAQQMLQQLMAEAQGGAEEAPEEAPTQMARHGAKLAYIRRLRGECPEGTEMVAFRAGGRVCKKCIAKKEDGGTASKNVKLSKKDIAKLDNAQRRGAKPFTINGKSYYLNGDGEGVPANSKGLGKGVGNKSFDENGNPTTSEKCGGKVKKRYFGGWI